MWQVEAFLDGIWLHVFSSRRRYVAHDWAWNVAKDGIQTRVKNKRGEIVRLYYSI